MGHLSKIAGTVLGTTTLAALPIAADAGPIVENESITPNNTFPGQSQPLKDKLTDLDIGRVSPASGGTAASLAEYRIWNRCRTADGAACCAPAEGHKARAAASASVSVIPCCLKFMTPPACKNRPRNFTALRGLNPGPIGENGKTLPGR